MASHCRPDPAKYHRYVDPTQQLDLTTIASCHSPVIEGAYIDKAFDVVRALPTTDLPDLPNQSVLEEIVGATAHHPA